MRTEIGYRLSGSFYLKGESGNVIGFDLPFPSIYITKDEAEESKKILGLALEKEKDNTVLRLYEGESVVRTIQWDEWWLYKCYKLKQECRSKESFADEDFEPHYENFKDIFNYFVKARTVKSYPLEYVQYWIEPIEYIKAEEDFYPSSPNKEINVEQEKPLEEEFLMFTEEEENTIFIGFLCEEDVRIDDLCDFLNFNKEDYFNGKRFLANKFEKEILTYENLSLKDINFARFWKYPDGRYYKRIIGETGIHMGYQFKYVKFQVV